MSGSFGSGGLGSFTVYPVEVTCDLAGDSVVTDSVIRITQGTAAFSGDSTENIVVTVEALSSLAGIANWSADAVLSGAAALALVGDSSVTLVDAKITVVRIPSQPLAGTAKPPPVQTIRINPPPVIVPNISISPGRAGRGGPKTDKAPR